MAIRNNTFILKRSNVVNKIPALSGLTLGELALNTADAKLYSLYTGGLTGATEVREIGWNRLSVSGGTLYGNLNVLGSVSATTFYGSGANLTNIPDTFVTGFTFSSNTLTILQNQGKTPLTASITTIDLSNVFSALTFNIGTTGSISATTFYGDGSNLTGIPDNFVTGGTFTNNTLTLNRQNGSVTITGFTDFFVTGGTYSNGTLTLNRQNGNVTISGLNFTGNTSASCITDLYVSNVYGCSPITIHDNIQFNGSLATGLTSFAFGYNVIASGDYSHASGSGSTAGGTFSYVNGDSNSSLGYGSFIGNGTNNRTYSNTTYAVILNGSGNTIMNMPVPPPPPPPPPPGCWPPPCGETIKPHTYNLIGNGRVNTIEHLTSMATILNGDTNTISSGATMSTIVNGQNNSIYSGVTTSTIINGIQNIINQDGYLNTIINGANNIINGYSSTIINSTGSTLNANNSTIISVDGITASTDSMVYVPNLDVVGSVKTTTLQVTSGATVGYVLTALDSNGNVYWAPAITGSTTGTDNFVTGGTYSNGTLTLERQNGSVSITGFSQYFISGSTPTGTIINYGDRWYNTNNGIELVYINDGNNDLWVQPLNTPGPPGYSNLMITSSITTSAATLNININYYGVNHNGNVDISLPNPSGYDGYNINIKDESGNAGIYRIRLTPLSGLIDGNNYVDMNINYMSLHIVARNNNWWII